MKQDLSKIIDLCADKELTEEAKQLADDMVEVVHYFDCVKGEEFRGTQEQWEQHCKFMGIYPYNNQPL